MKKYPFNLVHAVKFLSIGLSVLTAGAMDWPEEVREQLASHEESTRLAFESAADWKELLLSATKKAKDLERRGVEMPHMSDRDTRLYVSVIDLLPDVAEALDHLATVGEERMITTNPPGPEIHFLWGNLLYRSERYAEALVHYEKAIKESPEFVRAYLEAGMAAYQTGEPEKAIRYLVVGLALGGVAAEPRILALAGDLLYDFGMQESAAVAYREALVQDPAYLYARKRLAYFYYEMDRFDQALYHYLRLLAFGGGSERTYLAIARIYFQNGHFEPSLVAVENARFFNPSSRSLRRIHLSLLSRLKRVDEAILISEGLLREEDDNAEDWLFLARAYLEQGRRRDAISAFEMLSFLDASCAQTKLELASLYASESLPAQASITLRQVLEEAGSVDLIEEILALAGHLVPVLPSGAVPLLLDAMEIWTGQTECAETVRAVTLLKARRLHIDGLQDEARTLLMDYLCDHPDDGAALLLMGQIESEKNAYVTSRIYLERAAADRRYTAEAFLQLALLELKQQNVDAALERLSLVFELEPTPQLHRFIVSLCRRFEVDPLLVFPEFR